MEPAEFHATADELAHLFGGASFYGGAWGVWLQAGVVYRDDHVLVQLDLPDTAGARADLIAYVRSRLLPRFKQHAIHVTFLGPIETMNVEDLDVE